MKERKESYSYLENRLCMDFFFPFQIGGLDGKIVHRCDSSSTL